MPKSSNGQEFKYVLSYQSLSDGDLSMEIFDAYEDALAAALEELRSGCGHDDDEIKSCEQQLREQDYLRDDAHALVVRIDTATVHPSSSGEE